MPPKFGLLQRRFRGTVLARQIGRLCTGLVLAQLIICSSVNLPASFVRPSEGRTPALPGGKSAGAGQTLSNLEDQLRAPRISAIFDQLNNSNRYI